MQNCLKRRGTLVAIFILMFTSSSSTAINEFNIDRICQELLERTRQDEPGVKNADTREIELLTEVHSLSSLYTFGPSSFVRQHPAVIMSAPQVLAAMIIARGYTVVDLPWLKTGPIRRWNFFSSGDEISGGRWIGGQEKPLNEFVNAIFSQAIDRSGGSLVPTFLGGAGTGKTETMEVSLSNVSYLSTYDPRLGLYTLRTKNLREIPGLNYILDTSSVNGEVYETPILSTTKDSPFTILPPSMQQELIEEGSPVVAELLGPIGGADPHPFLKPNPQISRIRNEILAFYQNKLQRAHPGAVLDAKAQLEILDRYFEVVRFRVSADNGSLPIIEAQRGDIDIPGLFIGKNMLIHNLRGASDEFAHHIDGKFVRAYPMVLLDEGLRSSPGFISMIMGFLQSHVVNVGGASPIPKDIFVALATNKESWDEVKAEGGREAQLDRLMPIHMNWTTIPQVTTKIATGRYLRKMWQRELSSLTDDEASADSVWTPAKVDELFPIPRRGEKVQYPDGRYELRLFTGDEAISIAPRSLRLLGLITAATRMDTDAEKLLKIDSTLALIASKPQYRDPIARIKVYDGQDPMFTLKLYDQLITASETVNEGHFGIGTRNQRLWFEEVVNEAMKPQNNRTITPRLVSRVFETLLREGKIKHEVKDYMKWRDLAGKVMDSIIVPEIESDIAAAYAHQDSNVELEYQNLIFEIIALNEDPAATVYLNPATLEKSGIKKERLEFIKKYYLEKFYHKLATAEIAQFYQMQPPHRSEGFKDISNPNLIQALAAYYSQAAVDLAKLGRWKTVLSTGRGSPEMLEVANAVLVNMRRLGYNKHAVIDAFDWVELRRQSQETVEEKK